MSNSYKYSVALSFAEEDRNAALAMALALEIRGFKNVYYYPDRRSTGVGLNIKEKLIETYKNDTEYVVLFLSTSFFKEDKVYTKIELEAIKQRILTQPKIQYVIPILLDDIDLTNDDVLNGMEYIKWEYNPKEITEILKDKFGKPYPEKNNSEEKGRINIEQKITMTGDGNPTNTINNINLK